MYVYPLYQFIKDSLDCTPTDLVPISSPVFGSTLIQVGTFLTPYLVDNDESSSILTFWKGKPDWAIMGPKVLHGPHQGAVK